MVQYVEKGRFLSCVVSKIYTDELKKKLITHFSKYVFCCKSLRVGVMSKKVYIFGEDTFCRIHLWSQIYSKNNGKQFFLPRLL